MKKQLCKCTSILRCSECIGKKSKYQAPLKPTPYKVIRQEVAKKPEADPIRVGISAGIKCGRCGIVKKSNIYEVIGYLGKKQYAYKCVDCNVTNEIYETIIPTPKSNNRG